MLHDAGNSHNNQETTVQTPVKTFSRCCNDTAPATAESNSERKSRPLSDNSAAPIISTSKLDAAYAPLPKEGKIDSTELMQKKRTCA